LISFDNIDIQGVDELVIQGFGELFRDLGSYSGIWGVIQGFGELLRDLGSYSGIWGVIQGFGELLRDLGSYSGIWNVIQDFGELCLTSVTFVLRGIRVWRS
jgi:hypothetical protein